MDTELIVGKKLAKKQVTQRREATEEVLAEDDDLPGGQSGLSLRAGGTPRNAGGNEPHFLILC